MCMCRRDFRCLARDPLWQVVSYLPALILGVELLRQYEHEGMLATVLMMRGIPVLPGFTDTERLGNLSASIQERTGKSAEAVREGWLGQVPIGRLIDPLETASAITYLSLPASGGIRGVSLAVDGGRLRSI